MLTPSPRRRVSVVGLALTALVAGALGAGPPAVAVDRPGGAPVSSLRTAVAAGDSDLEALPRGETRRAVDGSPALRSSAQGSSVLPDRLSVARGRAALTRTRVSTVTIRFVDTPGNRWSTQAKAAFRAAADVWERTVESPVPISIEATARSLGPGLLGGAGPFDFLRNEGRTVVPGNRAATAAELRDDVFEPVALFNARTGRDALPPAPGETNPDIVAEFNPNLAGLYLGTDGRPPADRVDFRTVVLHEIGHGLGITGTAGVQDGKAFVGSADINGRSGVRSGVSFDQFTYATTPAQAGNGGTPVLSLPDGSAALLRALTGDALYWSGQQAITAARGRVELHAPSRCGEQGLPRACARQESPFVEGSSYSHLDELRYPRASPQGLMTPYLDDGEAYVDPGQIALGMLADMGYAVPALTGSRFTAVEPVRLLDTRSGLGARRGAVAARGVVDLRVAGAGGVPAGATAVVLNVTGVRPTAATDVRVYPTPVTATPVPDTSNLNLARGVTRANLVTVAVGSLGRVRLRNSGGSVHLLADLAGWYAPTAGSTFTPVDPVRLLDTRRAGRPVGPRGLVDVRVAGAGGVPAGATAAALTVTVVGAPTPTDVRVYPGGRDPAVVPRTSNVNAVGGVPVPNLVVSRLGPDGTVRLRNSAGSVHLLVDLAGYYSGGATGALFRPVTPRRVLDTRSRLGTPAGSPTRLGPGGTTTLTVGGGTGIPRLASAAVLNVTGVAATSLTAVSVYPRTATRPPLVSNLNLGRGQTAADLVVVRLGGGQATLRNSAGSLALVVDAAGWFGPAS